MPNLAPARNWTNIITVALLISARPMKGGDTGSKALNFYIVSKEKLQDGRFIDTATIPKLGYIAAKPDLVVSNLLDVEPQQSAPVWINRNYTVAPELRITLRATEAKSFAALTERAVGKRLLVMLGDKPLTAPVVRAAVVGGNFPIEFGREQGAANEAKKAEDDLKKLIKRSYANAVFTAGGLLTALVIAFFIYRHARADAALDQLLRRGR